MGWPNKLLSLPADEGSSVVPMTARNVAEEKAMKKDPKRRLIRDLFNRMKRLDCLAPSTRTRVLQVARDQMQPEQLRAYMSERLTFVEQIDSINHGMLQKVSAHMRSATPDDDLTSDMWLDWAFWSRKDPAMCFYCLANHHAMLFSRRSQDDGGLLVLGMFVILQSAKGQGRNADKLIESHVGLKRTDYSSADSLAMWAHAFAKQVEPELATKFILCLAEARTHVDRWEEVVRLLEVYVDLRLPDYESAGVLHAKIAGFAQPLHARISAEYLELLANALTWVSRYSNVVQLLETYTGLCEAAYEDPDCLQATLNSFTNRLRPETAAILLNTLANGLSCTGRRAHAARLLEVHVGLRQADYNNSEKLRSAFARFTQSAGHAAAGRVLVILANALSHSDQAAKLVEGFAGLKKSDYSDREVIRIKLNQFSNDLHQATAVPLVGLLSNSLVLNRRALDATTLLEVYVGLNETEYTDPVRLREKLRRFAKPLNPNIAADFVRFLAEARGRCDCWKAAATLLEAYAGVDEIDYANRDRLQNKITTFAHGQHIDAVASYLQSLTHALQVLGRRDQAGSLIDSYTNGFSWLQPNQEGPIPETGCALIESWLSQFGFNDRKRTFEVCKQLLPYLRRTIDRLGGSPEDRERFVESIGKLRYLIVAVADYWAAETSSAEEALAWRKQAAIWDAELGQRMLLERFLIAPISPSAGDGAARLSADRWPYPSSVLRPDWAGHRPRYRSLEPSANAAFDTVPADYRASESEMARCMSVTTQPWFEKARQWLREGLDEARLARELGPDTILLRAATLAFNGPLLWTALLSDGNHLTILAHDEGCGRRNDAEKLAWAVARHELRISLAYLPAETRDLARRLFISAPRPYAPDLEDFVTLTGSRLSQLAERLIEIGARGLANRLVQTVGRLVLLAEMAAKNPDPDQLDWIRHFMEQWEATAGAIVTAANLDFPDCINQATAAFINEIAAIWSLDKLAGQLDPEHHDFVVQVEGILHSIPVALLPVQGRPLWQQVRSVRASLSVLLDALQRDTESEAKDRDAECGRLFTLSWFGEQDRAGTGAVDLHHGQAELSRQHSLEWYAAAVDPEGTPSTLFAGLELGSFHAVSVCGHGNESHAGVALGPTRRLWNGQGRDLSRVELLLLVSCSMGRVSTTGARDAEGFCVQLALQRARSVLACRWPVQCQQAPDVANEVLAKYLQLRKEHGGQGGEALTAARLRAQALNLARAELLKNGDEYLNTLAAFELYGLG